MPACTHISFCPTNMDKSCKQQRIRTPPPHSHGDNSHNFKGIRMRKWGKWVSEVRMPNSRAKIWLGSYDTAEKAARAFDAAVYCLRGPNAKFNFPNSKPHIPSASSLSRHQIQLAAAKYALGEIPSTTNNNNSDFTEKPSSPSTSSFLSEMEASSDSQTMSEEQLDFAMWESLLGDSDGNQLLDLDEFPLFDAATLELTSPIEEQGSMFFDTLRLWNF